MRNFAIGLVILNVLYLSWNLGYLPGSGSADAVVIRQPSQRAPASLVLLSESSVQQQQAGDESDLELSDFSENAPASTVIVTDPEVGQLQNVVVEEVQAAEISRACLAVGNFETIAASNALVTELRQQGLQARLELQEQTESEYRVYMPPFTSTAAARQTLVNLLENGIDSFLITEGDLAQGISLGVFSVQESAFGLQENLAAEGYATNIQETVRSNTEFWIVINNASSDELEALWLTLLDNRPSLKQSENLCQIVAPEG